MNGMDDSNTGVGMPQIDGTELPPALDHPKGEQEVIARVLALEQGVDQFRP